MNPLAYTYEVIFIDEYEEYFEDAKLSGRQKIQDGFVLAIKQIIRDTGIVPSIGDWIQPCAKNDISLDIGHIKGRNFYPKQARIVFEIG